MFEFLFDIKPDAGNVCPTTRLAYLISERGNKGSAEISGW